mmetsp:Transcript_8834/g.8198  ORF Transcript_8834/g.8198 Transcript_8834/m.8198 type:complete len:147 (-) Transcript_8834:89-529(-)
MQGFINFVTGLSFYSEQNSFKFCTTGVYGPYFLEGVALIEDYSSTYTNLSASNGGVYYILATTSGVSQIIIQFCEFKHIYGETGGVFSLFNFFDIELSENDFDSNSAESGGLFNIALLSKFTDKSTFKALKNTFTNNYALSDGGVA